MTTIIIAFTTASFVASVLVVSACVLSSRLSRKEGLEERYTDVVELNRATAKSATPYSLN